jgi:hypothetical protein
MLLFSSYLPPVNYLVQFAGPQTIILDGKEHFIKQTIRNRCHILSPNGIQPLIIPVIHNDRTHQPVEDIKISYDHPWQRQHWRSIQSAYRRSAYFEFYMDDLEHFYNERYDSLLHFNTELLKHILNLSGLKKEFEFTKAFTPYSQEDRTDLRNTLNNGSPQVNPGQQKYPQVFSSKFGFVQGLSTIDLLFSLGPATGEYLKKEYLLGGH